MASPPILDYDMLLAPIEGPDPAGGQLPFQVRKKLDDARKEINPNQFAADDPRRPEQPQPADWPAIERLTQETLAQTSKDLMVAARLTEALVKQHDREVAGRLYTGFGGLRDGLRLLRRLAQECWDRVHPAIQDGDLEARAGAFNWLDDVNRGALFPYSLRSVPLTKTKDEHSYGWQQWRDAQEARGSVSAEAFDQAVAATDRAYCQTVVDDITASVDELNELAKVLGAAMGEGAPGLAQVRKALVEIQELAQQILQRKGPAPVSAPEAVAPTAESGPVPAVAAPRPPAQRTLTRDDVLARLADASALLLKMEPQSPIAYMIQRAVRLAGLPLPELMRVLIRDPGVLGQLDRDLDLGLDKQDAAKAGKK